MQVVDDAKVQARFSIGGRPQAIELICPHCAKQVTFAPESWHEPERQVAVADVACPRCNMSVLFLQLLERPDRDEPTLYVHPSPIDREPMTGVEHLRTLSAPLGRTYDSALKLFNQAEWGTAALTLRHLLGGLTVRLLPEDKRDGTLSNKLDALASGVDLAQPLRDISQLMAPGGTFARQFDDEAGIDRVGAEQLLELVEQLISYLVVLPGAMAELKSRIATAPVPIRRSGAGSAA